MRKVTDDLSDSERIKRLQRRVKTLERRVEILIDIAGAWRKLARFRDRLLTKHVPFEVRWASLLTDVEPNQIGQNDDQKLKH